MSKGFGSFTNASYYASFADLPPETKYHDPINGIDRREKLQDRLNDYWDYQFEKAMTIGTSAYAGYLIPVYLDPDIVNLTRKNFPFLEMVSRVAQAGKSVDYNQLTARGTADFLPEDGALVEQADTYDRQTKNIAFGYSVGRVTGPMIAASKQYTDVWGLEIQNKTMALRELQEKQMLTGNTTGDTDIYSVDANGYLGLNVEITTNTIDAGSATVTIDQLRQGVRKCKEYHGNPNLMVTDLETYDNLKKLFQDWLRYPKEASYELPWGITTIEFETIPIIASKSMPTAANKKQILILDMSVIEQRVLQDVTMEELAKTNDSSRFMIKEYSVLINKAEAFCCKIHTIA